MIKHWSISGVQATDEEMDAGFRAAVEARDALAARLAEAERLLRMIAEHDEWSPWQEPCRALLRTTDSATEPQ